MLQPGQVLQDRYFLVQKLGQNAGRQTWLAEDRAMQPAEQVVVKLLSFGEEVQWEDLKLFEREAQTLRQLNHPQIPKYRDYFSVGDRLLRFALVQDYIPGDSLKQRIDEGNHFSEPQVRQIATNLLHLLIYLHELSPPVLHRDIKPSNLILGTDHFIYLVDFGAVQDKAATEGATFTIVGTYGYAPMEQFGGRAVPASDLYSLGATLIHLLTGVSPAELPQQNLQIQFADRISLDPAFVTWIQQLTHPDVSKRFQSARKALEELRSLNAHPTPSPQVTRPHPPAPPPRQPAPEASLLPTGVIHPINPAVNSRIQVYQEKDRLSIQIPGTSLWHLFLLVPIGIFLFAIFQNLFSPLLYLTLLDWRVIFFGGLLLLLIAFFTYWEFLSTFVEFEGGYCIIYKRPFNFTLTIDTIAIASIRDVFHTLKAFRSGKRTYETRVIMIQTGSSESFFGKGLNWEDCDWLVRVIQRWLGLQIN